MMELTWQTLDGLGGLQVPVTVSAMQTMMDEWSQNPYIVRLARYVVRKATTRLQEAEKIRSFVRSVIKFRLDPAGQEYLQDPIVTLHEKAGDCDDMATLAGALLQAIGHECEAQSITWEGQEQPSHAVVFDRLIQKTIDPVAWVSVSMWPPKRYRVAERNGIPVVRRRAPAEQDPGPRTDREFDERMQQVWETLTGRSDIAR